MLPHAGVRACAPRGGTPGGSDVLDPKIGEAHARGKVDAVEGDVNVHSAAGEKSAALQRQPPDRMIVHRRGAPSTDGESPSGPRRPSGQRQAIDDPCAVDADDEAIARLIGDEYQPVGVAAEPGVGRTQ